MCEKQLLFPINIPLQGAVKRITEPATLRSRINLIHEQIILIGFMTCINDFIDTQTLLLFSGKWQQFILNIQLESHKLLLWLFCVVLEVLHLQPAFIVNVWKRATKIFFKMYHFVFHKKKATWGSANNIISCIQS